MGVNSICTRLASARWPVVADGVICPNSKAWRFNQREKVDLVVQHMDKNDFFQHEWASLRKGQLASTLTT